MIDLISSWVCRELQRLNGPDFRACARVLRFVVLRMFLLRKIVCTGQMQPIVEQQMDFKHIVFLAWF